MFKYYIIIFPHMLCFMSGKNLSRFSAFQNTYFCLKKKSFHPLNIEFKSVDRIWYLFPWMYGSKRVSSILYYYTYTHFSKEHCYHFRSQKWKFQPFYSHYLSFFCRQFWVHEGSSAWAVYVVVCLYVVLVSCYNVK